MVVSRKSSQVENLRIDIVGSLHASVVQEAFSVCLPAENASGFIADLQRKYIDQASVPLTPVAIPGEN